MPTLSQREALAVALRTLADLKHTEPCTLDDLGHCTAHQWASAEACPQLRTKHLMEDVAAGGVNPPYTKLTLLAMLNGCTEKQEVHVRVVANGYAHWGRLGHHVKSTNTSGRDFYADVAHGERIEQIGPGEILEAEVSARSLLGVPLDPTHDPA
ncbi:hypothetical protein ACFPC0_10680 [Streptomyces andamanensis]|uniref:Uncharacterized protein n=1 Tax=Streptomyces andamanensis TaxID=1565035 RepID=A0ABV8TCF0_9ACTN